MDDKKRVEAIMEDLQEQQPKVREEPFTMLEFRNRYSYTASKVNKISFGRLYNAFKNNVKITKEYSHQYHNDLSKEERDKAKDHSPYIMGESVGNTRKIADLQTRNMITLDLDVCPKNILNILGEKAQELDFRFFVYPTHSHTIEKPRLRLIIPLLEDLTPDEYVAVSQRIINVIGKEYFDATTTQPARIMYAPSCSFDMLETYKKYTKAYNVKTKTSSGKGDCDGKKILDEYLDAMNIEEWQKPHFIEGIDVKKFKDLSGLDSTKTKFAMVNNFNKEYSITDAIDTFLQDVYQQEALNRYTFLGGESRNGLAILNSQFAYSHHGTDPAQGRLLNAFDIVRIHKFGLDDAQLTQEKERDQYAKTTSFSKMCNWIRQKLPNVLRHDIKQQELEKEIAEKIERANVIDKTREQNIEEEKTRALEDTGWMTLLQTNKKGDIEKTPYNIKVIVENDPTLKNLFFYDLVKNEVCFNRAPYWDGDIKRGDGVRDLDIQHLEGYLLDAPYFLQSPRTLENTLMQEAYKNRLSFPKEFLANLPDWDGVKRVETFFIDLFDVADSPFIREASKKWFTGLVARIMEPGCKFDFVVMLIGEVGTGKSMVGKSLIAPNWSGDMRDIERCNYFFSDKEIDLKNMRDTIDGLVGTNVLEMAEVDKYFTTFDKSLIKAFITQTRDRFIPRYGRRSIDVLRSFVILATTNESNPIKNTKDERRFMPFHCRLPKNTTRIYDTELWNKEIRDQVLAEAMHYYYSGYEYAAPFSKDLEEEWDRLLERSSLENDYYNVVYDYINNAFPNDFYSMQFEEQKTVWDDNSPDDRYPDHERSLKAEFAVVEIFRITGDRRMGDLPPYNIERDIIDALKSLGFIKTGRRKRMGELGTQYIYERADKTPEEWTKTSEDTQTSYINYLSEKTDKTEKEKEILQAMLDAREPY